MEKKKGREEKTEYAKERDIANEWQSTAKAHTDWCSSELSVRGETWIEWNTKKYISATKRNKKEL